MIQTQNSKQYDLEERSLKFAAPEKEFLVQEATELMKIFGSILEKSTK